MTGRGRRVSFVVERDAVDYIRRTRGASQGRSRSRSADRTHTVFDDLANMQQGREQVGREAYNTLRRENHILQIDNREKDLELQRYIIWTQQLERENDELRRSADQPGADAEARKSKLKEARKKNARLEVDVDNLKDQVAQWRRLYEAEHRRYEEVTRRLDIMRENLDAHIEAEARLERENAALKRVPRRHAF